MLNLFIYYFIVFLVKCTKQKYSLNKRRTFGVLPFRICYVCKDESRPFLLGLGLGLGLGLRLGYVCKCGRFHTPGFQRRDPPERWV